MNLLQISALVRYKTVMLLAEDPLTLLTSDRQKVESVALTKGAVLSNVIHINPLILRHYSIYKL